MKRVILLFVVIIAMYSGHAYSQCLSSWTYPFTGVSHNVAITTNLTYLNGTALNYSGPDQYYIGAFFWNSATSSYQCGGYIAVDDAIIVLTAWGDDSMEPGSQGFAVNEEIKFKLMKIPSGSPTTCEVYDVCTSLPPTFDPGNNGINFTTNGMTVLLSLNFCSSSDAGVQQLVGPTSSCTIGANTPITVKIKNFGPYPISNVPVRYSINGGPLVTETYSGSIAGGATYNFTFATTADFTALGTYTITSSTNLNGDVNAANNSNTSTVEHLFLAGVSISGLDSVYCQQFGIPLDTLIGTPAGGTFTSNDGSGNSILMYFDNNIWLLDALNSSATSYTMTYTYESIATGCTGIATQTTTIAIPPSPQWSPDFGPNFCQNPTGFVQLLEYVNYPTGSFWGVNVTGTTFSLALPLTNNQMIYYYTDPVTGCSSSDTTSVNVYMPPIAQILGSAIPAQCINSDPITLVGSPPGGVFTGPGMIGNQFFPSQAGVGTHCIIYHYPDPLTLCTDASECKYITVNALPNNLNISGLPWNSTLNEFGCCINATPFTITGSPSGGLITGPGVDNNTFYPAIAGIGSHTIVYTYTNSNGCTNSYSLVIKVYSLPVVSFSGLSLHYCYGSGLQYQLIGTPPGLGFGGPGVNGNIFYPDSAGIGTHQITYLFTNPLTQCSNTASASTTVHSLPVAVITNLANSYCNNGSVVSLIGSPSGGSYSGPGTSPTTNIFNPAGLTTGVKTMCYSYTDIYGCTDDTCRTYTINPPPSVTLNGLTQNGNYCVQDLVQLTGSPSGGTYNGSPYFTTSYQFNPLTPGVFYLYYSYTNVFGCVGNSTTYSVTVNSNPTVDITNLNRAQCVNGAPVPLTGTPSGGAWSGPGVVGSTFYPSLTGPGIFPITYSYTATPSACDNSKTRNIKVFPLPNVNLTGLNTFYCQGAPSVTLTGTPSGGTYNPSDVFTPTTPGQNLVSYTFQSTYTYFTDTAHCTNTDSDTAIVSPAPPVWLGNDLETAQPDTVILNAGSFTTYLWSIGNISQSIDVPAYGNYAVTVTDGFGCYGVDTVLVGGTDIKLLELVSPKDSCKLSANQKVIFRYTNSGTYTFPIGAKLFFDYKLGSANKNEPLILSSPFAPGDTLQYKFLGAASTLSQIANAGNYLFRCAITYSPEIGFLPDVNRANDSMYVTVHNENQLPNPTGGTYTNDQPWTLNLDPGSYASYLWNTGELTQVINPPYGAIYTVTVTDDFGCTGVASFTVISGINDLDASIGKLDVMPNPSTGEFTVNIEFSDLNEADFQILDIRGKQIIERNTGKTKLYNEKFDLSNFPSGIYFLKLNCEGKMATRKLIIQQ